MNDWHLGLDDRHLGADSPPIICRLDGELLRFAVRHAVLRKSRALMCESRSGLGCVASVVGGSEIDGPPASVSAELRHRHYATPHLSLQIEDRGGDPYGCFARVSTVVTFDDALRCRSIV